MKNIFARTLMARTLMVCTLLAGSSAIVLAGQAPYPATSPDRVLGHQDRVYSADQFSNTVSVIDPADNKLLGVLRLGDPQPRNLSPLYRGQLLVHGLGFSPDGKTLAVVAVGSNAISFINTHDNTVLHTTYLGRSPHETFFTPDGSEIWVTIRGEDYVQVLDAKTFEPKTRIQTPAGPGMQIFSPDGKYGYICSSFNPETLVVSVADHKIVGHVKQASPFCPNIAANPDGSQVWFTLKDVGKVQIFDAKPPFDVIKTIDTGPITNHVNFARTAKGNFAYVTIGGLNQVKVFDTETFEQVATIPVGRLPHGLWPSGDGSRVYVGIENDDQLMAIDTATNKVIASIPVGQAPQAIAYVPGAVTEGTGTDNLEPLKATDNSVQLSLRAVGGARDGSAPSNVSLFDQGLTQVVQASVTGLEPGKEYVLALAGNPDGSGTLQALSNFKANPTGASIVNALGPIRQLVKGEDEQPKRYLVVAPKTADGIGAPVQVQAD